MDSHCLPFKVAAFHEFMGHLSRISITAITLASCSKTKLTINLSIKKTLKDKNDEIFWLYSSVRWLNTKNSCFSNLIWSVSISECESKH